jgi:predicted acylesterase/phospholipase RssA
MYPARHPQSSGKTALVLAGGGLTGAVYEIGALRAIDDLLVGGSVNDFDIYVGTSAGSLVASMLASGISPDTMLQAMAGDHPEIRPIAREDLFHLDHRDLVRFGARLPKKVLGAWSHYLRHLPDMTMFDLIWSLSEALPSGLYDNLALARYVRDALKSQGGRNRFDELKRDLHIIATDLDTGHRKVFDRHNHTQVPISQAVAASTAIPVFYKPVRIHGHDYIDGGVRGNASLDVAIENGATLVVCINPMVPFDNSERTSIPFLGQDGGYLSQKGLSAIASQVGRITSHAGLHYHVKQLHRKHPEVDIILIEPSPKDYQMVFYNIMRYSARLIVARHGFETVTLKLAQDYEHYEAVLGRHGIPINRRLVIEELEEIRSANDEPATVRRVLEKRSAATHHQRKRRRGVSGQLHRTLVELDHALAAFPTNGAHALAER